MNELSQVKGLIARGDKENAIALLASTLLKDKDQIEAWLLLGEQIDDPLRKKDCYKQVLRLSPSNLQALTQLQELGELPPVNHQLAASKADPPHTDDKHSENEPRQRITFASHQNSYSPSDKSGEGPGVIGFVIGGIAAFLLILYVILNPGSTLNNSNTLYLALIFIGLIATIIILSVVNKNRG
ncbi:MAG TPA: hypothetical protein VJ785_02285 [Anaerolineales bacterium]|nr:hypothetical protein [Anaerolineales bacterium]